MNKKLKVLWIPLAISLLILGGCAKEDQASKLEIALAQKDKTIEELAQGQKSLVTEKVGLEDDIKALQEALALLEGQETEIPGPELLGPSQNVLVTSLEVIELLKDKDMASLAQYVHGANGLRFTPYFYIDTLEDQVFTAQEVTGLGQNTDLFIWGDYDGVGDPINLTFNDYYSEFIYDEDFVNPQYIGNNMPLASGNMIDNLDQAYPNGHFVEFHFEEIDPQYAGMDWRSLRLVFEQDNGLWYLVGIVHGQWTV